jgi:hypothetical protein
VSPIDLSRRGVTVSGSKEFGVKASGIKFLSVIAASAVVGVGAVVMAVTQERSNGYSMADSTMQTGVTHTKSAAPKEPATAKAQPSIKGPAPLPPEEVGLPG